MRIFITRRERDEKRKKKEGILKVHFSLKKPTDGESLLLMMMMILMRLNNR